MQPAAWLPDATAVVVELLVALDPELLDPQPASAAAARIAIRGLRTRARKAHRGALVAGSPSIRGRCPDGQGMFSCDQTSLNGPTARLAPLWSRKSCCGLSE